MLRSGRVSSSSLERSIVKDSNRLYNEDSAKNSSKEVFSKMNSTQINPQNVDLEDILRSKAENILKKETPENELSFNASVNESVQNSPGHKRKDSLFKINAINEAKKSSFKNLLVVEGNAELNNLDAPEREEPAFEREDEKVTKCGCKNFCLVF